MATTIIPNEQVPLGVAELMDEKGLHYTDLMIEFGVTENTIRKWRHGEGMTRERIWQLADYFGATADQVIGRPFQDPFTREGVEEEAEGGDST